MLVSFCCFVLCQAVAYNGEEFMRRKFRVMNMLAAMFDNTDWLIVHSPFIYTAGVTKSVTLCDVSFAHRIGFPLSVALACSKRNVTPPCADRSDGLLFACIDGLQ
jgi:hypothetical protein